MAKYVHINQSSDVIVDTTKVTTGFFTGGLGTLAKDNLVTSSLSATQKSYYYNMQYSSEDQLSVTFGHIHGSGSAALNETKAVYKHFANLLLDPKDLEGTSSNNFKFEGTHPSSGSIADTGFLNANANGFEDYMYFLVTERARMKDRVNKENWSLTLSGSGGFTSGTGSADMLGHESYSGSQLVLTDDSKTVTATATHLGPRFNVVSGSDGTIVAASSSKYYGHFYPSVGVIALRGNMLSSSAHGLPGTSGYIDTASFGGHSGSLGVGFAPELNNDGTADNAVKLATSINMAQQKFRSEEDQTTKAYFCRALANDFNFSMNPTFISGSDKAFRNQDMVGYPHSFITTVGLYQSAGNNPNASQLVAVGRLSSPVQKNYGTEATIKVKLTY